MSEYKLPNFEQAKTKNELLTDIYTAIDLLRSVVQHPVDKDRLLNYKSALTNATHDLPFYLKRKGTRALEPNKMLCIYTVLNAMIEAWREYRMTPESGAVRCFELVDEIKAIAKYGVENHIVLGNLVEGYYLYRG